MEERKVRVCLILDAARALDAYLRAQGMPDRLAFDATAEVVARAVEIGWAYRSALDCGHVYRSACGCITCESMRGSGEVPA